jgi:uncharacterized protein YcaQ
LFTRSRKRVYFEHRQQTKPVEKRKNMKIGQIITVLAEKNMENNMKKGRSLVEKQLRPDWIDFVTCKFSVSGNVAGPESYGNVIAKKGEEKKGAETWWQWTSETGIVEHKTTKLRYIALVSPRNGKRQYFLGEKRITAAQAKIIKQWRKKSTPTEDFILIKTANVKNQVALGID